MHVIISASLSRLSSLSQSALFTQYLSMFSLIGVAMGEAQPLIAGVLQEQLVRYKKHYLNILQLFLIKLIKLPYQCF